MAAPGKVEVAAGHGALLGDLVALDGDAVEVAAVPGDTCCRLQVPAHHYLAKHLPAK